MIFGASNQNKNLVQAAGKKVDTSSRKKLADDFSAKVVSGSEVGSTNNQDSPDQIASTKKLKPASERLKGSYEGLIHQSSAHIQLDGAGYDNPGFQKARYQKKADHLKSIKAQVLNKISNNQKSFIKNDIITNYSSTFNGNSVANKMREFLNTDKTFR